MITEKERKNRRELFKLMRENPDLPVIPMVDGDLVGGDEFSRWMGSCGSVQIDEYLIPPNDCATMIFKSDGDVFDALGHCLSFEEFDALPESDEECRKIYDDLPWVKAIIVDIDLPD